MSAATKERKDLRIANEKLSQLVASLVLVAGGRVEIPEDSIKRSNNFILQVAPDLGHRQVVVTLTPKLLILPK